MLTESYEEIYKTKNRYFRDVEKKSWNAGFLINVVESHYIIVFLQKNTYLFRNCKFYTSAEIRTTSLTIKTIAAVVVPGRRPCHSATHQELAPGPH